MNEKRKCAICHKGCDGCKFNTKLRFCYICPECTSIKVVDIDPSNVKLTLHKGKLYIKI